MKLELSDKHKLYAKCIAVVLGSIALAVIIIVGINNKFNTSPDYDVFNDNLEQIEAFMGRNGEYLEVVGNYVNNPNDADMAYIDYYYPTVSNEWSKIKKHIRGGSEKNIFGERALSDEYYAFMNKRERDVLRNYYSYVENVLELRRLYDKDEPRNLTKIVNEMEEKSDNAKDKLPIIIEKYYVEKDVELSD